MYEDDKGFGVSEVNGREWMYYDEDEIKDEERRGDDGEMAGAWK